MKKGDLIIDIQVQGAKESSERIKELSRTLSKYFAIGKKFKIPKTLLLRMIEWQVAHKTAHGYKPLDINSIKLK